MLAIRVNAFTEQVATAAKQVELRFAEALSQYSRDPMRLSGISELWIGLSLMFPTTGAKLRRPSGSFDRATGTFYAGAEIDYIRWVSGGWRDRVEAYRDAALAAVSAVHKTRISETERQVIAERIREAADRLAETPPQHVERIGFVTLKMNGQGDIDLLSFAANPDDPDAVPTSEAMARLASAPPPLRPEMVKLHRRAAGVLEYFEFWPTADGVLVHSGRCGERGEVQELPAEGLKEQEKLMKTLARTQRLAGFRPVPPSRMAKLILSAPAAGDPGPALERRHALEDVLDQTLGWLGLGHCDGGEIGAGSVRVFCEVVDWRIASEAVRHSLQETAFADFQIMPQQRART